jgi:peptide/nickel transport system substrate-binding protein
LFSRKAIGKTQAAIIIVVIVVALTGGFYYHSITTVTPTSTTAAPTSLVVEEDNQPDSMDPAVTYITPGWEVANQVYQALVAPAPGSVNSWVGVLARNWTVSQDGMTYNFSLRQNVVFSNGDPYNAYVQWFSIYRTLLMNQAPAWILGQNLAASNGAGFNVTDATLNSIDYANPSQANLTVMGFPQQSVQVVNPYELVIHVGYGYNGNAPYSAFLATLETPMAMAVDPKVVEANGGVVAGQPNNWMQTNAVGTGFYELQSWLEGQSVTLVKNQNYWGSNTPSADLNYTIQPAIIDKVNIYYKPVDTMISDLKSGFAQIIGAPITQYSVVTQIPNVNVSVLPIEFGSAQNAFFVYMDPYAFAPFQNRLVREAVANAIDYASIINAVFNGRASRWVGPIPPGFPYYDEATAGLQPYQYDPVKAASLLAQAGYVSTLPNGTILNKDGAQFPATNFLYNLDSSDQTAVAQILASELHAVGITVTLTPLSTKQYSSIIYGTSNVNDTQYPFGISYYTEDYTASIDYVTAIAATGSVGMSGYYNQTVVAWQSSAATALDNATIVGSFQKITRAMYYDYTDVWLYVPEFMTVNSSNVTGMIPNLAGSGAAYFMFYNTVTYT